MSQSVRGAPRANIHQFARMFDEDKKLVGIGFVVNVSATGMKIETKAPGEIPEVFLLSLSMDDSVKRLCAVVWRAEDSLGVKFVESSPQRAR
jgi:hypothetical protein